MLEAMRPRNRASSIGAAPLSRIKLRASRMKPWEPVLWLVAFAAPVLFPSYALIINEIAIVALFAVSLDLVLGYSGIVSLGHAAFFGLGAYTAALFCKHLSPDPHLGLLVAMGATALLGFVASFTVLRGSDLTRLMVTLGVALLLAELANKLDWLTGGAFGLEASIAATVVLALVLLGLIAWRPSDGARAPLPSGAVPG